MLRAYSASVPRNFSFFELWLDHRIDQLTSCLFDLLLYDSHRNGKKNYLSLLDDKNTEKSNIKQKRPTCSRENAWACVEHLERNWNVKLSIFCYSERLIFRTSQGKILFKNRLFREIGDKITVFDWGEGNEIWLELSGCPTSCPPAFSIVPTDRELGVSKNGGYKKSGLHGIV